MEILREWIETLIAVLKITHKAKNLKDFLFSASGDTLNSESILVIT